MGFVSTQIHHYNHGLMRSRAIYIPLIKYASRPLFRNKWFMLDEMTHRNTFKNFHFLVYVNINQGIYLVKNRIKYEMKVFKSISMGHFIKHNNMSFFVFPKYGKFWSILLGHSIKHKPLTSEGWYPNRSVFLKMSQDSFIAFRFDQNF